IFVANVASTRRRGPLMLFQANRILKVIGIAALASAVIIGPALAASERPLFVSIGDNARPPIGWVEFCSSHPGECNVPRVAPRDVVLSARAWRDLVRVNEWVNRTIQPVTDLEHWGVVERWSYPDDGRGDCEDYVLLK